MKVDDSTLLEEHRRIDREWRAACAATKSLTNSDAKSFADARRARVRIDLCEDPRVLQLQAEITGLKTQLQSHAIALQTERAGNQRLSATNSSLEESLAELQQKEELAFLLSRVSDQAQNALFDNEGFRNKFFEETDCSAFVVSVDIRRSTELMLKARSAQHFASFITEVCQKLECIVKECFGVFDKFTGDGVLAFFPEFFSGPDGGLLALQAAQRCQEEFERIYKQHRRSFTTVLRDVGLGIGIDYGPVHLLRVAGGITVVGSPVVYACRLSGAPAGHILVNQPAYEVLFDKHGGYCHAAETTLDIKHEGSVICYDLKLRETKLLPAKPGWQIDQQKVC